MKTIGNSGQSRTNRSLLLISLAVSVGVWSGAPSLASDEPVIEKAPVSEHRMEQAKTTARAVNQIPGVQVKTEELVPPALPPIKGFHPIKRLLRPVENLGTSAVKMQQQIMRLEGPIAALHPPMTHLEQKMGNVNGAMNKMQDQVTGVSGQMKGVREDLANMQKDVGQLKAPILAIQKPLVGVAKPLDRVKVQLNFVLLAIVLATIGVVFGMPLAAIIVYRNKEKLFPAQVTADLPDERPLSRV